LRAAFRGYGHRVDEDEMRARLAGARVGRLGTVSAEGVPHLVPVCFALAGELVFTAVDAKPKRPGTLRRVTNIVATRRAVLLVDEYAEDWNSLWWVRVDATARIVQAEETRRRALDVLIDKYPQYESSPPPGPVIELSALRLSAWTAVDDD
jgi:PPOX class probable F420-dependent enzyme